MADDETPMVSVVDDDESLRRSLRNLLGSVGFRVETFASAEAFLQSNHHAQTGCLVLDLRMPGINGLDLLRALAGMGRRIPTVILTAHGDDVARRRSLEAGAVAFLSKPFNGNSLLEAVRAALSGRESPESTCGGSPGAPRSA
jgi:FixJ family two-component response regulator